MRHAKSAWDTDAATDFERPLAPRGRKTAPRMGRWLASRGLVPDRIVSSPATRAAQTAALVAQELGVDEDAIVWDERLYGADADEVAAIARAHDAGRLLLVGHNPAFEDLAQRWGGRAVTPDGGKHFPTATVARVRWGDDTPAAVELVRPRDLE